MEARLKQLASVLGTGSMLSMGNILQVSRGVAMVTQQQWILGHFLEAVQ